jgi:uncharacterized protein
MIDIEQIKEGLPTDTLRQLQVQTLYLFGSNAENTAGEGSDIDVAVLFPHGAISKATKGTVYQSLYEIFTDLFDMTNFKTIDIVFLSNASLELQHDVVKHGIVLFDTDEDQRLAYEERVSALYRDFKPILDANDKAILERI